MSLLKLENEEELKTTERLGFFQSNPNATLAIIIFLLVSALGLSAFGGYYFAKHERNTTQLAEVSEKLSKLTSKITFLETSSIETNTGDSGDLEQKLRDIEDKIDELQLDVKRIKSDVGSIQLKIGY